MDKDKGFIKLDRSIFEHWIFQDAEKFRAFVDLIQLARWRDEKLLIGNEVVLIPRGSYYTSELKLADRWGWSRKKIREFFKLLEKEQMIIKKGTTKGTMLTVVNYGLYQDEGTTKDTTKEQQKNIKRTTKEHQKNNEGYTKEEIKMIEETKKILHDDTLKITATTARVPVLNAHSESINVELNSEFELENVIDLFNSSKGIIVHDDVENLKYPTPLELSGKDEVFVGRIRRDFSLDNGLNLWVVADNIRKGAALNAIQIAEILINEK